MYRNILLPQLRRAPWRTALFFVLTAIAAAFFCLSLNLYENSNRNIAEANNAFSTIGVIEFYQNLDAFGNPVAWGESGIVDKFSVTVSDLNFENLCDLPGVASLDLRPMFSAYIPGYATYEETTEYFSRDFGGMESPLH